MTTGADDAFRDTREWATARLAKATQNLAKAQNNDEYAEWYVTYLNTRIAFYQDILAKLG